VYVQRGDNREEPRTVEGRGAGIRQRRIAEAIQRDRELARNGSSAAAKKKPAQEEKEAQKIDSIPAKGLDSGPRKKVNFRLPVKMLFELQKRSLYSGLTQTDLLIRAVGRYLEETCPRCGR
jgi:hypothetical protein